MTVRVRIAPSPTGDPHVGTAYIALFNYAFAKQQGGKFILRIEDTDQTRSTPESERAILDALRWVGLDWDEGPDVGGPHGPYRQSERMGIYREYAERLVAQGDAFYCFMTADELHAEREAQLAAGEAPRYAGTSLSLSEQDVQRRLAAGEAHVIRMKVPTEGLCVFTDRLRGDVEIPWDQVDMQILLKSDGMPTYHLANVVDDHLMQITHVIRGEEWIPSAPKHQLLYRYFGWDMPELIHMPLLRNPDKSKLSKRKNPTSVLFYQRFGVMAQALLNYLGRMGYSFEDEREQFTLDEMIEQFNIDRVSLGGPVFDVDKLLWLNGEWMRSAPQAVLAEAMKTWALNADFFAQVAPLVLPRMRAFSDLFATALPLFSGYPDITAEDFGDTDEQTLAQLQFLLWRLEAPGVWNKPRVEADIKGLAEQMGLKLRAFMPPLFIAICGSKNAVSVMDTMAVIGPDLTRNRLRHAIEVLGGVSKKAAKRLEKQFKALEPLDEGAGAP